MMGSPGEQRPRESFPRESLELVEDFFLFAPSWDPKARFYGERSRRLEEPSTSASENSWRLYLRISSGHCDFVRCSTQTA
ncbi:hypothetical protein V1477_014021 [Vespula maculifrons]